MLYIILMCTSHFMFFVNNLFLDVYFMFILDYRNDGSQKVYSYDFFYSSSKWVVKQQITCNINNAFGPGIANEHTVQWWLKKFCKGDESLENEELSGQLSEVDNNQLRAIIEANPLTTMWEVTKELNVEHSMILWHLKKIGNVKNLDKWVPHELTENQEAGHSDMSSSLTVYNNNEPFLHQIVTCDEKWILYNNQQWPAQWLDRGEAPKHFPKPTLHHKRSRSLVVCCPSHPLELSESQRNHYIWEVCSANWWHAPKTTVCAAGIGQQKGPNSSSWQHPSTPHTASTSVVEQIGLRSFASSTIFTWPLANWPPLLQASWQLFAWKTLLQTAEDRKCIPRVHGIPKHVFLCYRNKLISHWQKCVDCNGSYFD